MTTLCRNVSRLVARHSFLTQSLRGMSSIREVQIPVPWGHIAGRESGPTDGRPLLMLHGWLDNCGTFDAVQQHLPQTYRCVNIDLPGHGLSSHMPVGSTYSLMQGVLFIRLVRDHFGWQRFSLMGHSMGSGMSMLYAATFPEDVESLTVLDLVKFLTRPVDQHPSITRDAVLAFGETERKLSAGSRPQYGYDELRRRLVEAVSDLDDAAADALLVRGARRDPETGLYEYTYDLRHRQRPLQPMDMVQWGAYARRLRCRLLLVLAESGGTWIGPEEEAAALDIYRGAVPELHVLRAPGGHHVHLTHPENVLPHINGFLRGEPTAAGSETATADAESSALRSGL
ncbi:probable serine hydrolase [Pollicipes pollicipes]|uniref:probable serine hydrolase n=1 Tax=Pollicipes pollicipes TaxID=41117 RepID=UPI0018857F9B|nr:probable serine hydrolase [Pollicipes pollicipes]